MPAAGRSTWVCGKCKQPLAHVRGVAPRRRLIPIAGVLWHNREDGKVSLDCPKCSKSNLFEWRMP